MSYQVVRIEKFMFGSLKNIGNELQRTEGVEHRNSDIDVSLKKLNRIYVYSEHGFYNKFHEILSDTNCTYSGRANQIAFEGMIITSDTAFFESLGWERGMPAPKAVEEFFDRAYEWALSKIGVNGTDINIIGAQVHYDEKTPHLQLYYIPIVDRWKEKVYEKDENGKVKKNENGSPIQARDENGRTITKTVIKPEAPKLSRNEFWQQRGGKTSYRELQDSFYSQFTEGYGYTLERGEIGSDRKHKTKNEYEAEQLRLRREKEEMSALQAEIQKNKYTCESINLQQEMIKERLSMSKMITEKIMITEENKKIESHNKELGTECESLQAKVDKLSQKAKWYENKKAEVESEIRKRLETYSTQKQDIAKTIDDLKAEKERLIEEIERMATMINIPPQPPMLSPIPPYDEWCEEHELQTYPSHHLSKKKREEEQEELRRAAYAAEVAEYEEALAACDEWVSKWESADIAKRAIEERDGKDSTIEHYRKEYSLVLRRCDELVKEHGKEIADIKEKHSEAIAEKDKIIKKYLETIAAMERLIDERVRLENIQKKQ